MNPNSLYSIQETRSIEDAANASLPAGTLMRRAGAAAAALARKLMSGNHSKILVLAGPGNNGGDALEAAHLLAENSYPVTVLMSADAGNFGHDAMQSYLRAQASGVQFHDRAFLEQARQDQWSLVIDGLFGIGLSRPITGELHTLIKRINSMSQVYRTIILSLDVPSGLNADTGQIIGPDGIAIRATHTLSFIGNKPGLHTGAGRDYAGQVEIADLQINGQLIPAASKKLSSQAELSLLLQPRRQDTHKGSFGDVLVIGGDSGMMGAPILSARAAACCGAGRVFVGMLGEVPAYDSQHPELMLRGATELDIASATVVVIGPGLGQGAHARELLRKALLDARHLVIDADALNLLASNPDLQSVLASRDTPSILTPHPLEAARLLKCATQEVQEDRLGSALKLANLLKAVVVLKGSGSVIAEPGGRININHTGNPALASAGTGDVLSGVCGAMLAQQLSSMDAATLAVCMHGQAADMLVAQGQGPIGLTASELIPAIRTCLNKMTADNVGAVEAY